MKNTYIYPLFILFLIIPISALGQKKGEVITLTGTVTDTDTGTPLQYVSVYDEKGGFGSSHTDEKGNYSVQIIKGNKITFARQFYYGRTYIVNFDVFNIALKPIPKEIIEEMEKDTTH